MRRVLYQTFGNEVIFDLEHTLFRALEAQIFSAAFRISTITELGVAIARLKQPS